MITDRKALIRTLQSTLEMWSRLDDYHKGQSYQKAVDNLTKWKEDLEKEELQSSQLH